MKIFKNRRSGSDFVSVILLTVVIHQPPPLKGPRVSIGVGGPERPAAVLAVDHEVAVILHHVMSPRLVREYHALIAQLATQNTILSAALVFINEMGLISSFKFTDIDPPVLIKYYV